MSAGPTLHVAALPFPSPQGTQAAIGSMLAASVAAGRQTHLLCYAHGEGEAPPGVRVHRIGDFPRSRSLRSGPSAAKLALDLRMAAQLRQLARRIAPGAIVAHHVEAASLALPFGPTLFFAHTDLGAELPVYGPNALARPLGAVGRALDHMLLQRSDAIACISPLLAQRLGTRAPVAADRIATVPVPWPLPLACSQDERARARRTLGLAEQAPVLLYTGNLDAYQGWELALDALTHVQPQSTRLLVATRSDVSALQQLTARRALSARVVIVELGDETVRRTVHAAADLLIVPRRVPGGLPIKLIDGLARGLPAVVTGAARAGFDLGASAIECSDDARAIAQVVTKLLASPEQRDSRSSAARAHVRQTHAPARFLDALDGQLELARARHRERGQRRSRARWFPRSTDW